MFAENDREWEILQVGGTKKGRYLLFRIRFEKAVRFMIYIEATSGECALECTDMNESDARACFTRMVNGELAPCHLRDWLRDETLALFI